MGFFSKPRGIDAGKLQQELDKGLMRQRGVVERGFRDVQPLTGEFQKSQQQLGEQLVSGSEQRAQEFGKALTGLESPELLRQQQAKATELSFRNLPAAQQMIRENLAATGGLSRGAAISALQRPVLEASQRASDTGFQLQEASQQRDLARQQQAVENLFKSRESAALQKLGIDQDTAMLLLQMGRGDILDKASALAGIEGTRTQGMLDIEQQRQQSEIARDAARRQQIGAVLSTVGSLGGAALGAGLTGGSPIGASIGSSVGGQLGGLAGGGSQPLDLSGALSLAMLNRRGSQPGGTGSRDFTSERIRSGRPFVPGQRV